MSESTVADLNGHHIGQRITITHDGWEHNGTLAKVEHETSWIGGRLEAWVMVKQPDGSRWHAKVPGSTPVRVDGLRGAVVGEGLARIEAKS